MRSKLNRMMARKQPHMASKIPSKSRKEMKILDQTRPLKPAPDAEGWLVVMVEPRCEEKAAQSLREAGHLAWHPQMTLWLSSARLRLRTKVNRPLFPRYLFVAKGEFATKSVTACDHITYLVGEVPRNRQSDRNLLVELSSRQDYGEFDISKKPKSPFKGGEEVMICDGDLFDGLEGVVGKTDADRTTVLLQLLGSVVVDTIALKKVA